MHLTKSLTYGRYAAMTFDDFLQGPENGGRKTGPFSGPRPLRARRVGNQDSSLGFVWQAEEVFKDGRWRRSYGFLGLHDLAVVPADAIEFPGWPCPWQSLSGPLDAWLAGPESLVLGGSGSWTPIVAGTPLVVSLRLRNRGGLDISLPTEFVRPPGADGAGPHPALRRGVVLALSYAAVDPSQPAIGRSEPKWEGQPPKITDDFTPGSASRTLGPAESIEALRLDLNDWFAIDRPGLYRLRINFTKDCGFAEGASNETTFPIVEAPAGGRTPR
jgi:hypothetical protein